MTAFSAPASPVPAAPRPGLRLGCVSFLNAKPLIDGLELEKDDALALAVPSRLLEGLESGDLDLALCPVIDYQRSGAPLRVVPAGGIGCDGPTLTVRLFSRVPLHRITHLHADTDSHTSVALLRVLLAKMHGIQPVMIDLPPAAVLGQRPGADRPQAMLLIGDKVVTRRPDPALYPLDVDLGQAWHELTGLPFVFAVWLAQDNVRLGDLPQKLLALRLANQRRVAAIVTRHAAAAGWPHDLAMQYLGGWLRYEVGSRQLEAIELFWRYAREVGVLDRLRPMNCLAMPAATPSSP